jgi:RNA polymerase sigma-B factor
VSPNPSPVLERPAPPRSQLNPNRAREDRALFERYYDEGGQVDREMLVERFLPLARELASRYRSSQEPFDDLFQVACLGLINAIDSFELERGIAFSSYAVPTILGEIKRYFRDRTWAVRVPRDLQELSLCVDRTVSQLTVTLHRQPTVAEISDQVGVCDEDVLEALEASGAYRAVSLEAPPSGDDHDGDTLGDTIRIDDARLERAEDRALLARLMRRVTPREREVLCCALSETSHRLRSASASGCPRCRSRASSAKRSGACGPPPQPTTHKGWPPEPEGHPGPLSRPAALTAGPGGCRAPCRSLLGCDQALVRSRSAALRTLARFLCARS